MNVARPTNDTNEPTIVAGVSIAPGERTRIELPAGRLATGGKLTLPLEVLHGVRPGPRVWLSAAIHGDELNGVEVVRKILGEVTPGRLAGTLLAIPIVNVQGFIIESRYLPDRRDLNRSFPGSPRGSMASQLAHLFMREIVAGCSLGIDLHTGSDGRTNLPQIRADLSDPETARLARAFGAPALIHASVRDGSLRAAASDRGGRVLVFEGGEALRFERHVIDVGFAGVLRVLHELGMRKSAPPPPPDIPIESRSTAWIRAGRSGLARIHLDPGDRVAKGDRIGIIRDAFGDRTLPIKANRSGVVIGLTRQPNVNRGDALIHVATPVEDATRPNDETPGSGTGDIAGGGPGSGSTPGEAGREEP